MHIGYHVQMSRKDQYEIDASPYLCDGLLLPWRRRPRLTEQRVTMLPHLTAPTPRSVLGIGSLRLPQHLHHRLVATFLCQVDRSLLEIVHDVDIGLGLAAPTGLRLVVAVRVVWCGAGSAASRRVTVVSRWPCIAAPISGVRQPCDGKLGSAFAASSAAQTSVRPDIAAPRSAVCDIRVGFGKAPSASSCCTACPFRPEGSEGCAVERE